MDKKTTLSVTVEVRDLLYDTLLMRRAYNYYSKHLKGWFPPNQHMTVDLIIRYLLQIEKEMMNDEE